MTERPLIFSPESVRKIYATHKTQTRRVIKPQPEGPRGLLVWEGKRLPPVHLALFCPHGQAGDRLWVKETFGVDDEWQIQYRAGWKGSSKPHERGFKWRAPFYMKREQSRLLLEIENVRVEPIQSISEADATAEGFIGDTWRPAKNLFRNAWEEMHGPQSPTLNDPQHSWDQNPWVWAIYFKVIEAKV